MNHFVDGIICSGPPKKVMLGDRVLSKSENKARVLVDVEEIIIHPEYKPPVVYNDIALIKMKSKVNLSRSILPACMPQPEDRLDKIKHVIITGFGQLGALGSISYEHCVIICFVLSIMKVMKPSNS
jgi:hypothetical protein